MIKTLPIDEAKDKLSILVRKAHKNKDEYIITMEDKSRAVLVSAAQYESLKETLEILSEPGALKEIREAEAEIERGEGIPWEEAKKELGWD